MRWKKTLVVVSHDRDFLNNVTTDIVHLHDLGLHFYRCCIASRHRPTPLHGAGYCLQPRLQNRPRAQVRSVAHWLYAESRA